MNSIKFVEINPSQEDAKRNGEKTTQKSWVLVYLVGSIGDTIVCIPALEAIRRQFPNDKIILLHDYQTLVPVSPLDIVPKNLINGSLSYVMHSKPLPKLRELYRLRRRIRQENIKAVVYLVATERFGWLVWRDKLFFRLCGIKNLIGFYPFEQKDLYKRDESGKPSFVPSEAKLKLERLERDDINIQNLNFTNRLLSFSNKETAKVKLWLDSKRKKPNARLIAFCPGCKNKANDWGVDNLIELGKRLLSEADVEIIIIGGKVDKPSAEKMITAWGEGIDAAGEFKVNESGVLFAHCDFMIGYDTGTTHLAAAAGISCFALYGQRQNPGHWFPLGKGHLIIQHDVECAGCLFRECPKPDHPCMKRIEVEAVWGLLKEFMTSLETASSPVLKRVLV